TVSVIILAASFGAPFAIVWTTSAANFSGSSIGRKAWASTGACHASSRAKASAKMLRLLSVLSVPFMSTTHTIASSPESVSGYAAISSRARQFRLWRSQVRHLNLAVEIIVGFRGTRVPQHHDAVTCRAKQIVVLLDDTAVLAVIEPKFFPPIIRHVIEDLEPAPAHAVEHYH